MLRSPGLLTLARLRRDRPAMVSGVAALLLVGLAVAAPAVGAVYGVGPEETFAGDLDPYGMPYGVSGGVSASHWFGLEPGLGRDIFVQVIFGMRTSLAIAGTAALVATAVGAVVGGVAGYLGGWADAAIGWLTDVLLALPLLICAIALIRPLELHLYGPRDPVPGWFRAVTVAGLFGGLGWMPIARLVRGQVIALREQEFVTAARASGAGARWIVSRELLPHLGAPVLTGLSLLLPAFVAGGAALSFLGLGVLEPTADLGRMIYRSLGYLQTDPAYVVFPSAALFLLVFAFSTFNEGLRDALDPRALR
ncbi:ABC transporter permease [Amorphoplanes nipponensis]|uniref:ABC transporter permease n=1 Tax=Actinoplanes nipponensis TaxID=135950 RepID=A0A919JM01_9ACTN|nr:ABC transporter permease [Actinoplanes nipponensis]GIE53489.1 ABC transporter permease [Actinoplanes nipponensis]